MLDRSRLMDQATIETIDDCRFTINSNLHPAGKTVGILTYIPFMDIHQGNPLAVPKDIDGRPYAKISGAWFSRYRNQYMELVRVFPHYHHEDPFFGRSMAVPDEYVRRVTYASPVPDHHPALVGCSVLEIPRHVAGLVGSSTSGKCNAEDIDIGIIGRENAASAMDRLRIVLRNPENRVNHGYFDLPHPKQFTARGRKFDLFYLYSMRDVRPLNAIPEVGDYVEVEDIVENVEDAHFIPAVYRLESGKMLVSYQIEHTYFINPGDRLIFHAHEIPQGYLIRQGDDWEDITADRRLKFVL